MQRINIYPISKDKFCISGCGEIMYFQYESPMRDDVREGVNLIKSLWDQKTSEDTDVIVEVHYKGSRDINERLITEFDSEVITSAIEKLSNG